MQTAQPLPVPTDVPKITEWYSVWISGGSALIAVAALVAAFIAARATIKTNRNQSKQLERFEETQEREQASRVAVWVESGRQSNGGRFIQIWFHNGSGLPAYETTIHFIIDSTEKNINIGTLPPTEAPRLLDAANAYLLRLYATMAADTETVGKYADSIYARAVEEKSTDEQESFRRGAAKVIFDAVDVNLEVTFSDGTFMWRRIITGQLCQVGKVGDLLPSHKLSAEAAKSIEISPMINFENLPKSE